MLQKSFLYSLIYLIINLVLLACFGSNVSEKVVCGVKFKNSHYDIGNIEQSSKRPFFKSFCFSMQNTNSENVLIDSVEISCGCLHIDYAPEEIKAFATDSITGYIDISDLRGSFSRSIYVNFSGGEVLLLHIVGKVD